MEVKVWIENKDKNGESSGVSGVVSRAIRKNSKRLKPRLKTKAIKIFGIFINDFFTTNKLIENSFISSSIKTKIPIESKVVLCQKEKFSKMVSTKIDKIKEKKPAKKPANKQNGQ